MCSNFDYSHILLIQRRYLKQLIIATLNFFKPLIINDLLKIFIILYLNPENQVDSWHVFKRIIRPKYGCYDFQSGSKTNL